MGDELEKNASFLDEIGRLFDSHTTSTSFLPHRTKLFSDYNEARPSVKGRIFQFSKFISMKFLIAVLLPVSPFINFGDFCQLPRSLFRPKFVSFPVYSALPFYLKLESIRRNTETLLDNEPSRARKAGKAQGHVMASKA